MTDERTGQVHDFRRKRGVAAAFTLAPADAPEWARDRTQLWNATESAENRKNSTVAREWEVALPTELDDGQRHALAQTIGQQLVDRYGIALDVAIHRPGKGDDRNHHAHMLGTTRRMTAEGLGEKTRELDEKKTGPQEVTWAREMVARETNAALERAGQTARVDHRSLKDQGVDRPAQPHLGPHASAVERRTGQPSRIRQDWHTTTKVAMQACAQGAATQKRAEAQARAEVYSLQMQADQAQAQVNARLSPDRPSHELTAERQMLETELRHRLEQSPPVARAAAAAQQATARRDRAAGQVERISKTQTKIRKCARQVQHDLIGWEKRHPVRAWLHRLGFKQKPLIEALQKTQDLSQAHARAAIQAAQIQQRYAVALATAEQAKAQLVQARKVVAAELRQAGALSLRDSIKDAVDQAHAREWQAGAPAREAARLQQKLREQIAADQAQQERQRLALARYQAIQSEIENTGLALRARGVDPIHASSIKTLRAEAQRLEQAHAEIARLAEVERQQRQAAEFARLAQGLRAPAGVDRPRER